MIADRPEFSFYSGAKLELGSNADLTNANLKQNFESKFQRKSLLWLLALAKVEFNSTMAMYGDTENAFAWREGSKIGMQEYFQVLLEDLAVHLHAISNDPALEDILDVTKKIRPETAAYLIRLKLISSMLTAVHDTNDATLMQVVKPYMKDTAHAMESIVVKVYMRTNSSFTGIVPGTTKEGSDYTRIRYYSRDLTNCQQSVESKFFGNAIINR